MNNTEKFRIAVQRSGLLKTFIAEERFRVTRQTVGAWLRGQTPKAMAHKKEMLKFTRAYSNGNKDLIAKIEDWA